MPDSSSPDIDVVTGPAQAPAEREPREPAEAASEPEAAADEAEEPATPAEAVADAVGDVVAAAIQAWVGDHIHGSAVAQSTPAWNHLFAVLPKLTAGIVAAIKA